MMSEQLLIALASFAGLLVVSVTALRGWQGWLTLKERELERNHYQPEIEGSATVGAARIEIADLKERIRKLEAIASGVDL